MRTEGSHVGDMALLADNGVECGTIRTTDVCDLRIVERRAMQFLLAKYGYEASLFRAEAVRRQQAMLEVLREDLLSQSRALRDAGGRGALRAYAESSLGEGEAGAERQLE